MRGEHLQLRLLCDGGRVTWKEIGRWCFVLFVFALEELPCFLPALMLCLSPLRRFGHFGLELIL